MSSLARRVLTGALLALGAAGLLYADTRAAPGHGPLYAAFGLALLCALEASRMGRLASMHLYRALFVSVFAAGLVPAFGLLHTLDMGVIGASEMGTSKIALWYGISLGLTLLLNIDALYRAVFGSGEGRERARWAIGLSLWIFPSLFALVPLGLVYGTGGLVLLVILSKIGDIFGYFVGRKIGRRHPFPKLSPGKTVAGCVASLVAGSVAGAICMPLIIDSSHALLGAVFGATLNLSAQAGDLAESWVKRNAGVKDSSTWVGAAGGVLDVLDSFLFTVPTAVFLLPLVVS